MRSTRRIWWCSTRAGRRSVSHSHRRFSSAEPRVRGYLRDCPVPRSGSRWCVAYVSCVCVFSSPSSSPVCVRVGICTCMSVCVCVLTCGKTAAYHLPHHHPPLLHPPLPPLLPAAPARGPCPP
eukprot:37966-Eustigmatos_ZCMA.PRE.1